MEPKGKVSWWLGYGVLVAFLGGCAKYQPLPLTPTTVERALTVPSTDVLRDRAKALDHPILRPVLIGSPEGLTPDAAAVLAVLVNPAVRADRNRLNLAAAQLLQADILPNPQLDVTVDPVTGGNTLGTTTGYLVGLSWDVVALITHDARVAAARSQQSSVRLDVAWQEWQVAQAAKKAAYDLISLRAQVATATEVDRAIGEDLAVVRRAVDAHQKTLLDLSAAEAASQKAHTDLLVLQGSVRRQELALNHALGVSADTSVPLRPVPLPSWLDVPPQRQLLDGLEDRRLDLVALRRGYESQEEVVRAAVLSQFPKLVLNVHQASDTSNVHTTGTGVTLDLPVFNRNQGNIAVEQATRQRLFDEYAARVFEARATVVQTWADIRSLTEQIADAEAALPAMARLEAAYRAAVGQGNADVLSYYSARGGLASRQLDVLRLKQQLLQSKVALEVAAGLYLPDGLPPAAPASRPAAAGPATREAAP